MYLKTRIPYDRGDLLPGAYWQKFAQQAGVTVDEKVIKQLRQVDKEMWSRPNEPMIRWLQRIHAGGFKTAILSNMPTDMADHVRETFPWLAEFDQHIFSAEVRSAKPEPAIYRHAIEGLGVAPPEALFIDDREENVAGRGRSGCGEFDIGQWNICGKTCELLGFRFCLNSQYKNREGRLPETSLAYSK